MARTRSGGFRSGGLAVVVGMGAHGRAVARALLTRGYDVVAADDRPSSDTVEFASSAGIPLHTAPDATVLAELMGRAVAFVPTPGLPESHLSFDVAAAAGVDALSEFDLAQAWDDRPMLAVTGTDGKTTVTTLAAEMLTAAGHSTLVAGNTEPPLVEAIDDAALDLFVVEASSFRLATTVDFAPQAAMWLNFGPDHLDVHASLEQYELSKARIWQHHGDDRVAIANGDDPVVRRHAPDHGNVEFFGSADDAIHRLDGDTLLLAGDALIDRSELQRDLPHDVQNALAAAALARVGGADLDAIRTALRTFRGLPHRVEFVAESNAIRWFNDSKATTPHAVLAGVGGFDSVVLIAGGRNKGLDLTPLAALTPRVRAVVALGEAAAEIDAVFAGERRVVTVDTMAAAIEAAGSLAEPGDAVVLSPGCTSYDLYQSYGQRGDDFRSRVLATVGAHA